MKEILKFVRQFIPVALGVYLALLAGNWNEERKLQKDFEAFKIRLTLEIENNTEAVKNIKSYHTLLKDSVQHIVRTQDFSKPPTFWKGFRTPNLSSNIFDIGKQTNMLNRFSLNDLELLFDYYGEVAEYSKLKDRSLASFDIGKITGSEAERMSLLINLQSNLVDFYYQENELLDKGVSVSKALKN